ncbi:nuclear transport factor 2 family protein [Sphingobium lignivorans]|uniref:SnoaL-like aldol condensation-catalyzing enzyme n=1 Tax=Sphingobium lignivorans TaxID=2735886 RepID=A0ABR6ND89_9SPHN|nr:nuclear transport factor 2 family protein [Sphingobium lignivorans]MBB5985233.1 putative SnoaL-like aldol condensation-catalyzing enzyme [Sphingobium lignivorans]
MTRASWGTGVMALALGLAGIAAPAQAAEGQCDLTARQVVERFIPLFYEQKDVRTAFMTWVAEDYIQHNPVAKDGRDNGIAALEPFFRSMPELRYTVARVIAEGDLVVVHNKLQMNAQDRGSAVVDIFRVENCKIVEHWDVIQPIPEKSANPHPMF